VTHVKANEGQIHFLWFHIHNLAQSLHRPAIHQVATDSVNRVGRINNDSSLLQNLNDAIDFSQFRIFGMYREQFGSHSRFDRMSIENVSA
jgi:hypothetical protein